MPPSLNPPCFILLFSYSIFLLLAFRDFALPENCLDILHGERSYWTQQILRKKLFLYFIYYLILLFT